MYIKGVPDYTQRGEHRETGLFAGLVSSDGELRSTQNGKQYGSASVRAFSRKDGTAAFLTIKSFGAFSGLIANLRKGDHILCAGMVETREYNGKQYTDMLVDFLLAADTFQTDATQPQRSAPAAPPAAPPQDDFEELGEAGELPF